MKKLVKKALPKLVGSYINTVHTIAPNRATKKAFNIFSTPRKGKIKPHQEGFLNAARSHIIEHDNILVQTYHWPGNGDTVLLIHGWDSNAFRWKTLVEHLQQQCYNIIALDAPAHGNSGGKILNVPLYTEFVRLLVQMHNPKHIIGHSVGGMTTIYHQMKFARPETKKLVILGAPSELKYFIKQYQSILGLNNNVIKSLDADIKNRFGFESKEFSIANFSSHVDIEGLIIHDVNDKIALFRDAEAIHGNWKKSTLIKTSGLGHSLHHDDVYQHILNYINA